VDNVWAYAVTGVIALLTAIYLFAAMLFPERF
jgi:K+-transporting ATPase KdpF subunit